MKIDNPYTQMQKQAYSKGVYQKSVRKAMRGEDSGGGDHFKPLNDLDDIPKFLFKNIPKNGVALDLGCGVGRAIVQYKDKFQRIDGVDISDTNISVAKEYTEFAGLEPNLWVNNGVDLRDIPSNTYDVVFSIQVLLHICVYDIRRKLLEESYRALKPGGWICIQMGYGVGEVFSHRVCQYYENLWDVKKTNGKLDCTISDPNQPKKDLEDIGFKDFSFNLRDMNWNHPQWIYFRGQK
jgi:ubiquinone/menaquinone biosynthesis C-methylase UbiE